MEEKIKEYQKMYGNKAKVKEVIDCGTHDLIIVQSDEIYLSTRKMCKSFDEMTKTNNTLDRISTHIDEYTVLIDVVNGKNYLNSFWAGSVVSSSIISKEELISKIIEKYNIELA